jgi:hypothetical protein
MSHDEPSTAVVKLVVVVELKQASTGQHCINVLVPVISLLSWFVCALLVRACVEPFARVACLTRLHQP